METMLKSLAEVAAHKRTPFHLFVILAVTSVGNPKLPPSNLLLQPYCAIYNKNYGRGWPKRWQKNIDWNVIRQQIHIDVAGDWFWFREGKLESFHIVCCWTIHLWKRKEHVKPKLGDIISQINRLIKKKVQSHKDLSYFRVTGPVMSVFYQTNHLIYLPCSILLDKLHCQVEHYKPTTE